VKTRAAVLTGPRAYEIRELDVPDPPRGGAILEVVANGLCGSDYELYTGALANMSPAMSPFPLIPGHEIVGRIETISPEAERHWGVTEGDRVVVDNAVRCGECRECREGNDWHCLNIFRYSNSSMEIGSGLWGGMSEYMELLPRTLVIKVPEGLTDEDASLFNPLGNAEHWTSSIGRVALGENVLILGAGQRGAMCALIANRAGASQVLITGLDQDMHKADLLKAFGATHVINAQHEDPVQAVQDHTEGTGVDLVVDTTPGAIGPVHHAIAVLRPHGRLVFAGAKGKSIDIPTDLVFLRELQLLGASGNTARGIRVALDILAQGGYPFDRMHSHHFGLDNVERAVQILGNEIPDERPFHITITPNRSLG
jgi:2-desacetyl-2-hydroxyethyl bacteriochlorophyllide A dehydrogenase